jgi:hypothetical protein
MKIDPVYISLAALGVSMLSLWVSISRAAVDRRLQWEQMRGGMQTTLTAKGVELLTLIEELRRFSDDETLPLVDKLIRIAEGTVDIRQRLKRLGSPPFFSASHLTVELAPIKHDLDEAEPIFDKLRSTIAESKFSEAHRVADGLIERLYGSAKG